MKKSTFTLLLLALASLLAFSTFACGDIEGGAGESCDPEEEPADGFECVCDDNEDPEFQSCTLESIDDSTNNDDNNNVSDSTAIDITNVEWVQNGSRVTTLTIDNGDTVTWTNNDDDQRNVTCDGIPEAEGDMTIAPGQSFAITFDDNGSYRCYDRINTNFDTLETTIVVQ